VKRQHPNIDLSAASAVGAASGSKVDCRWRFFFGLALPWPILTLHQGMIITHYSKQDAMQLGREWRQAAATAPLRRVPFREVHIDE
jgi:hypothetical protein